MTSWPKLLLVFPLFICIGCNQECDDWTEGEDCVEMRQKFFGTYVGVRTHDGQIENPSDTIQITEHPGGIDKMFFNYYTCQLTSSTTFDIPYTDADITFHVEGNGSGDGNQITIDYLVLFGDTIQVNFTGSKL